MTVNDTYVTVSDSGDVLLRQCLQIHPPYARHDTNGITALNELLEASSVWRERQECSRSSFTRTLRGAFEA